MKYFVLAAFCITIISVSGCKKSTDSPEQMLTTHNWYLVKTIQDTVDLQVLPCVSDDYITFQHNGTAATYYNGSVKCDTSEPTSYAMTYNFNLSKTINIYNFDGVVGQNYQWNVVSLTNSTLEVTFSSPNGFVHYDWTYLAE